MAKSPGALNPASIPFFPGKLRASSEGEDMGGPGGGPNQIGFRVPNPRQQEDRGSMSTLSISPSEYRSVRSSPSPSSLDERDRDPRDNLRFPSSHSPSGGARLSPAFRQTEAERPYPNIEARTREASTKGTLETLPENTPQPRSSSDGVPPGSSPFFSNINPRTSSTPPANISSSRSSSFNTNYNNSVFTSSSPVSSLDSNSLIAEHSLETQLKALPLIHDILDRLVRCEYTTREIQRDLGDVHRKVNLLVERSLDNNANHVNNTNLSSQPEFKDPFASGNPQPFNVSPMNVARASMSGAIAPNQSAPSDDIGQISQRLNTLTTSVGQLLALQTHQRIQTTNVGMPNGQIMGGNNLHQDLAPNQMLPPPMQSNANNLGHGLPTRPDLRQPRAPNPPMRTWSAGTLDLPMRPSDTGSLGRSNDRMRDQRRSVTGGAIAGPGLMRRESTGVSVVPVFLSKAIII